MSRSGFWVAVALAAVLASPAFAGGAKEGETAVQLSRPPAYISPGHPETGHEALTIDNIKLTIDQQAAIKSYTLNIYDKSGDVIFTRSESKLEGRGFFGELLNIGDIPQVKLPASFNWPGTGKDGRTVPDGEYSYQLTVLDSYGKKTSTAPLSVVVDTKPPRIFALSNNYRVLSPNGDGVRDAITFSHKTEPASVWREKIVDAQGKTVWAKETAAPGDTAASDIVFAEDTVWDGRASAGADGANPGDVVPEGDYSYQFSGADRAGNAVSASLPFVVSNSQGDIGLALDKPKPAYGARDGVAFAATAGETKGLVGWKLDIVDADGVAVRRYGGNGAPPAALGFDGRGNPGRPESEGYLLPDGAYRALLSAQYDSGAQSNADPVAFRLDSTAPVARLVLDSAPDSTARDAALAVGGAGKEKLKLSLDYEPAYLWTVKLEQLSAPKGAAPADPVAVPLAMLLPQLEPVESHQGAGDRVVSTWLWPGTLPGGALAAGLWKISLTASDDAGNVGASEPVRFVFAPGGRTDAVAAAQPDGGSQGADAGAKDLAGAVQLSVDPGLFSPDGDGVADQTAIRIKSGVADAAEWTVDVLDPRQRPFRSWKGAGAPPESIVWDGTSDQGELAQSGLDYPVVCSVSDRAGAVARGLATVTVDLLLIRDGDRLRIAVPGIRFAGDSADLFADSRRVLDDNLAVLQRLAAILNRFPEHRIRIEGHAAHVKTASKAEFDLEETAELQPLSQRRAVEIKQALNILAVGWDRMEAVGMGGTRPVAPPDDAENRWKNRRVEFVLEK